MFKRIALAAVAAGVLALPAVASASTLPPIGPLKPIQVKWIYGPSGSRRLRRGHRLRARPTLRRPSRYSGAPRLR